MKPSEGEQQMIFVGDDWAEAHHDVYVCDEAGTKLAARRVPEGIAGMTVLHELVASLAADPAEVVVGIETDRGLWVHAMVEAHPRIRHQERRVGKIRA